MAEKTTIEVRTETWRGLMAQKQGPSDSFDDVIQRLLENTDVDEMAVAEPNWTAVRERHDLADDELEAAKAVWSYLENCGGIALKSDVLADVMPEHDTGKTSEDNWWRTIVSELENDVWSKFHAGGIRLDS